MANPTLPNFFIAGAPKSGTTSLYHNLRQHPEVYLSPVKEPAYFAFEIRVENFGADLQAKMRTQMESVRDGIRQEKVQGNNMHGIVAEWDDYIRLFEGVRGEKAIGEASVCYLCSRTAPEKIAACAPGAKIILILRDPAERAFSQYLHFLSNGHGVQTFREQIEMGLQNAGGPLSLCHPFLEYGLYAEQLERYLDHFPKEQVRVWIYEDTLAHPEEFLREVFEFLGVDAAFRPDTSQRYHRMEIPRALRAMQRLRNADGWKTVRTLCPPALKPLLKRLVYRRAGDMRMNGEDRRFLAAYYRADVMRLQRILGRDLSAWRR